jgi:acyl-CoA synthetase (NDP forming)
VSVDLDALRAHAVALEGEPDRMLVPEPFVKDALRALGTTVPRGVTAADGAEAAVAAKRLDGTVVLKAFGRGIVHKSDIGAVRVGLAADDVEDAVSAMAARLAQHGMTPAGFLVEEYQAAGVELIVGAVQHDTFGRVALLGVGGTLTELVDRTVMGLYPLDDASARAMVDCWTALEAPLPSTATRSCRCSSPSPGPAASSTSSETRWSSSNATR